ncbi:ATP-binding protein [Streptomyces sedi]|uniref:ATP-binding protein n=1 Tax=Streptomyces sedi TaxID=555059 RepID=UPI001FE9EEFD|nr:NB-ARC domain-containing protein [Streptomyces sedi]
MQAGAVSGGVHFHSAPGPTGTGGGPVPRQLPGGIPHFVNRDRELARLDAMLVEEGGPPFAVPVCLITGTAGGGKTSLALRWARQVRERFPDGQLHINLRGYDPGEPVSAAEALHRFLGALGVRPENVPAAPDAAAALYRSLLAGRRMLVLLDNAATAAQVRPLLPGTASCLTLVTSRSRLPGLAIRDGARRITLGTLPEAEAVTLLRSVTAETRTGDAPEEWAELARLCAGLPLALRIAAERAAGRPHLALGELIDELRDESALWDALSTGEDEEAEAVRTVFAWSFRALPAEAARMFRLLGLHPGPDFAPGAAAALAGVGRARARQLLDVLVGAHLLEQSAPDRYAFHDLLRAYAFDQARRDEPEEGRRAALRRLLEWYLGMAVAAAAWLSPTEEWSVPEAGDPGVAAALVEARFPGFDAAMDFAEREFANLVAAVPLAARLALPKLGWRLAAVLWDAQPPSTGALLWPPAGRVGREMAEAAGDAVGQAVLLTSLGMALVRANELTDAVLHYRNALDQWRGVGDRAGVADVLSLLGLVHMRRRELGQAVACFDEAHATFRAVGPPHRAATVLANLATARLRAGESAAAGAGAERALAEHRELGDRRGEGNAWSLMSEVLRERGEFEAARDAARRAVGIAWELRNRRLEGYWLLALGAAQLALDDPAEALVSYQRAAALQRRHADRGREALAWQGAGVAYRRLGRAAEGVDFLRRAVAAQRAVGDDWHAALALADLADALADDDAPTAAGHRAAAVRLLGGADDPRAVAVRERLRGAEARSDRGGRSGGP